MRTQYRGLLLALSTFLAACFVSFTANAQVGPPQDRYIVVLNANAGIPEDVAADLAQRTNGRVGYVYNTVLSGFSITMPRAASAGVARDPRVAYVEEDLPVSAIAQTLTTGVDRIFRPDDGDASPLSTDIDNDLTIDGVDDFRVDVDVAVLDTGIDWEHPDLNVVDGANCLFTTGNGPPWARNYYCEDVTENGDDDHYHGTHVAGTIAALDNGIGVVGVAPGADLYAVKVLDSGGSGYTSGIIAGIDWVVAHPDDIEVINMSLGGSGVSTAYETAIDNAVANGVVVVVAAGNSDADANNYSPAFVPSAITVSALADFNGISGGAGSPTCRSDQDETLADFSNWGTAVDIAAPGVCIESTYPIERGSYGTISGTSMAAPHIAGAAALLASTGMTVANIKSTLYGDANCAGGGTGTGNCGWTDDSGDGVKEPLLDITSFSATFIATGGGGGGGNTAPTASFIQGDCVVGVSCQFTDTSSDDGTIVSWEWNFGDGTTSTEQNPLHTFGVDGTYDVTLTVTDDGGLSDDPDVQVVTVTSGGGGGNLSSWSENNGGTWTAFVSASSGTLTGTWSLGGGTCSGKTCSLSGIRKRQSSVTFTADGTGEEVTVLKP